MYTYDIQIFIYIDVYTLRGDSDARDDFDVYACTNLFKPAHTHIHTDITDIRTSILS